MQIPVAIVTSSAAGKASQIPVLPKRRGRMYAKAITRTHPLMRQRRSDFPDLATDWK